MTNSTNTQELSIVETKDIVTCLKTAKSIISFKKADKEQQKLLIAVNNNKLMAIGYNNFDYAIAVCDFPSTESFMTVVPLEKSEGKEIGLCPFMKAIQKLKKNDEFTYRLEKISSGEYVIIAQSRNAKFTFNTWRIESFNLRNGVQTIVDNFMKKTKQDEYEYMLEIYGSIIDKKSHNHICFDGINEYFSYDNCIFKAKRFNTIDNDTLVRTGTEYINTHSAFLLENTDSSVYPSAILNYLLKINKVESIDEGYKVVDTYGIDNEIQPIITEDMRSLKSHNHICFDGLYEYFIYQNDLHRVFADRPLDSYDVYDASFRYRSASVKLGTLSSIIQWHLACKKADKKSPYLDVLIDYIYPFVYKGQSCDLPGIENKSIVDEVDPVIDNIADPIVSTEIESIPDTVYVPGVGNMERIDCKDLQVGMYLYFNELIYTVSNVEQIDFINHKNGYIVTVANLVNAIDYQKIILNQDELVTAWQLNFEKPVIKTENKAIAPTTELVTDNKAVISLNSTLPKQVRAATHDRGIKGSGRDMLIKMLSNGATLDQVMTSFNWSKKTASNHMTYVRQWGYNLELEKGIYQVV